MVYIMRYSILIPCLLVSFSAVGGHHEELVDQQALEEAELIEELATEQSDSLASETPLITPGDNTVVNSGVIDRYPGNPSNHDAGSVARSAFALAVVDREPVDEVAVVTNDSVYYFTDLRGLEGETIRHRWIYQGEVMADVEFTIGGPRWRVWSKKSLLPRWSGQWTVSVVDDSGAVIQSETVRYSPK